VCQGLLGFSASCTSDIIFSLHIKEGCLQKNIDQDGLSLFPLVEFGEYPIGERYLIMNEVDVCVSSLRDNHILPKSVTNFSVTNEVGVSLGILVWQEITHSSFSLRIKERCVCLLKNAHLFFVISVLARSVFFSLTNEGGVCPVIGAPRENVPSGMSHRQVFFCHTSHLRMKERCVQSIE